GASARGTPRRASPSSSASGARSCEETLDPDARAAARDHDDVHAARALAHAVDEPQIGAREDRRDHDLHLEEREREPDADPRPAPEREELVGPRPLPQEPPGIEAERLGERLR